MQLYVGVDGGATKSIIRVEDETGHLLGQTISGPANIRISVPDAWQSIHSALEKILPPLGIAYQPKTLEKNIHIGIGLAGCEVQEAYQAFLQYEHSFQTLMVTSDAHTACLGAHAAQDGAIIVIGTGVVGLQIQQELITKVGGYGFPHDDEGGGAWLGLQAVKKTLQVLDKRMKPSPLTQSVYRHFQNDVNALVFWANRANSSAFAELAPFVISHAQEGDDDALALLHEAARFIDDIGLALLSSHIEAQAFFPLSLTGGIAPFVQPYLTKELQTRLRPCQLSPESGAILLVKNRVQKTHYSS